jgi:hypothetical protein
MKKQFFLAMLLVLFCCLQTIAQDVIIPKEGEPFECKIKEVNEATVKYALPQTPNAIQTMQKEAVKVVRFNQTLAAVQEELYVEKMAKQTPSQNMDNQANPDAVYREIETPKIEAIKKNESAPSRLSMQTDVQMYAKGLEDAKTFYQRHTGAGTGVFLTTFFFGGIGGLLTVAACSNTPQERNLGYPSSQLMEDLDYKRGYIEGARRKKQRKLWQNFGIGLGSLLLLFVITQ